uniref:Uncharacterized protein n=1 Tax=Glossina pallidipes TaxID=7398 RepID=A0A1B0A2H4_GLOPL
MLVFLAFLVVSGVLVSATESETIVIDSSGSFVFIAQHSSSILFIKKTCWPIANLSWQRSFALYQSWETYQCYSARLYVLVQQFAICNISYRRYSSEAIKTDLRINLDEQNEQMKMNHSKEQMLHSPINLKRYENHLVNMSFFQVAPANGIHGKKDFNLFTKYLSKTCAGNCFMLCRKFRIKLQEHRLPAVTLAIIINVPVPFFDAFLKNIERLNYPKKQMHLFIYNGAKFHDAAVRFFYKCWQNKYKSSNMISSTHQWNEQEGRQRAM